MIEKRCAIYTRKSHEEGLEQEYNSLDAQRDACEAYIKSQAHEGWRLVRNHYDDGGFSGGTLKRPALTTLMQEIQDDKIDVIVVYKIDRLTRSLMDFSKIMDVLDASEASFAAVTQHFNTTTSMGRLTLNVLLSFAQFEREVTGERIRDKIAASKKKGMWMGGPRPLGYDIVDKKLVVNEAEAETVRAIFEQYLALGSVTDLVEELDKRRLRNKRWMSKNGEKRGGTRFKRGPLYRVLQNEIYIGKIPYKSQSYDGQHAPIIPEQLWAEVQAQLERNRQHISEQKSNKERCLLSGLIYDSAGNRMTSTYSVKNKKHRYPYYVSAPIVGNRKVTAGEVTRVPAEAIEGLVIDRLKTLSNSTNFEMNNSSSEFAAICRVTIYASMVEVEVDTSRPNIDVKRLDSTEDEVIRKGNTTLLRIQVTLRKWSRQLALISPNGTPIIESNEPDTNLLRNISRAHRWRERLDSGDMASVQEIAEQEKCTDRYVRKVLPLAYLAPDIIDSILDGNQPASMALKKLIQTRIPVSWNAQRTVLGFVF